MIEPVVSSRRLTLVLAAVAALLLVAVLGPRPDPPQEAAATPRPQLVRVPQTLEARDEDLSRAMPAGSVQLAGKWGVLEGGVRLLEAATYPDYPVMFVNLDGGRSGTVSVEGEVVDGWSVATAINGPGSMYLVSVRRDPDRAELVRVSSLGATVIAREAVEIGETVRVDMRVTGRLIAPSVAGVELPVVMAPTDRAATRVGFVGRQAAGRPGEAAWTRLQVVPGTPIAPPIEPIAPTEQPVSLDSLDGLLGP